MTHTLKGQWQARRVWLDGRELTPERSQRLRNHSPDGFNWGYGGSGPAQLALAVLLMVCHCDQQAYACYQRFKWRVIATLPEGGFTTTFDWPMDLERQNHE